jgi:hypothetical protein
MKYCEMPINLKLINSKPLGKIPKFKREFNTFALGLKIVRVLESRIKNKKILNPVSYFNVVDLTNLPVPALPQTVKGKSPTPFGDGYREG